MHVSTKETHFPSTSRHLPSRLYVRISTCERALQLLLPRLGTLRDDASFPLKAWSYGVKCDTGSRFCTLKWHPVRFVIYNPPPTLLRGGRGRKLLGERGLTVKSWIRRRCHRQACRRWGCRRRRRDCRRGSPRRPCRRR